MQQIPAHTPKEECDMLIEKNMILGCCKPFRVYEIGNEYIAEKCEYI